MQFKVVSGTQTPMLEALVMGVGPVCTTPPTKRAAKVQHTVSGWSPRSSEGSAGLRRKCLASLSRSKRREAAPDTGPAWSSGSGPRRSCLLARTRGSVLVKLGPFPGTAPPNNVCPWPWWIVTSTRLFRNHGWAHTNRPAVEATETEPVSMHSQAKRCFLTPPPLHWAGCCQAFLTPPTAPHPVRPPSAPPEWQTQFDYRCLVLGWRANLDRDVLYAQ